MSTAIATNEPVRQVDRPPGAAADQQQFLSFLLGGEEYGVDILRVQEIKGWDLKGWDLVTPIPNSSEYILGVINLRGIVVPIIDLGRRFGKKPVGRPKTTVVIVVKVQGEKAERTIGFVVDAVVDVYTVNADQLHPPPDLGPDETRFVKGLVTVERKMVVLLWVDQLGNAVLSSPRPSVNQPVSGECS